MSPRRPVQPRSPAAPAGRTVPKGRSVPQGRAGPPARRPLPARGKPVRAGTGRPLWLLGAVGVLLAVLILPYFQKWLVQRSQLETARSQVAQTRRDVADLQARQARWQDDDYVRAQARARLKYVMPGEVGFDVLDPRSAATPADPGPVAAAVPGAGSPWYADVWASARVAGQAGN